MLADLQTYVTGAAEAAGVPVSVITSYRRARAISACRAAAMVSAKRDGHSTSAIGRAFGKHRRGVIYHLRKAGL